MFDDFYIVSVLLSDLPAMGSTSRILQRLYSLDISSPDPTRYLIQHDKEEQCLTNLNEPELKRLLYFLDKVRAVQSKLRRFRDRLL